MPHFPRIQKHESKGAAKGADLAGPGANTQKQELKGKSFADGESALAPVQAKGGMMSGLVKGAGNAIKGAGNAVKGAGNAVKDAIGLGKGDHAPRGGGGGTLADPKRSDQIHDVCRNTTNLSGLAVNITKRLGQVRGELQAIVTDDYDAVGAHKSLFAKVDDIHFSATQLSDCQDQVDSALVAYDRSGNEGILMSALRSFEAAAMQLRVALTGLQESGDSVSTAGVLANSMTSAYDGIQIGKEDDKAGKYAKTNKGSVDGSGQLPLNFGVAPSGLAVLNNGNQWVQYCDKFRVQMAALKG